MTPIASIERILFLGDSRVVVYWIDTKEKEGITSGTADSEHIKAFIQRFARENPGHQAFPQ